MGLDFGQTLPLLDLLDHPSDGFAQGLTQHGTTGLADGRQACLSPFLRTVVPQLCHQGAIRQEDEIHVPCLALTFPELTVAHTQMLLSVPIEGLCSCPAFAIRLEDAMHFPVGPVADQDLARLGITLPFPQHHDPHGVCHTWNADTLGEVPLNLAIHAGLAATQWSQLRFDPLAGLGVLAIHSDGSIELQITDIRPPLAVDMIEDFGIGEVTVEGDIAGNVLLHHPIDQLFAEHSVILERFTGGATGLLLAEAAELQWVMLAGSADVVGDQVIMGDQMTLVSMIPEPAGIFDQLAVVVDQRVIDRDDTVLGVARGGVVLQELEPPLVEGSVIPVDLGDPAVQTGWAKRSCTTVGNSTIAGIPAPGDAFADTDRMGYRTTGAPAVQLCKTTVITQPRGLTVTGIFWM